MDFIGALEDIDRDWARLETVLEPGMAAVPPEQRRNRIPAAPPVLGAGGGSGAPLLGVHARSSAHAPSAVFEPPFHDDPPRPFTKLHALLVCRRYIQDFVCFDLPMPEVCAAHPELALDLQPLAAWGNRS